MNFIFVPSLQHAVILRTASLVYHPEELQLCRDHFINYPDWDEVELKIVEKLSSFLPDAVKHKVAKAIRYMHREVQRWWSDHYFVCPSECSCTYISWKTDGTINRTETARKIIGNENIDSEKRFIMACTYFLEDEIQELWEKFSEEDKNRLTSQNTNLAVRFWMEWLQKEKKIPWLEIIDEYFRISSPKPFDIPERVSCFYQFLSSEGKNVYMDFLSVEARVHSDDFQEIINKMDESERIEIFRDKYMDMLRVSLRWPMRCIFVKVAKQAFSYMSATRFLQLLVSLFRSYVDEEYEDFHLYDELWQISPDNFKTEAKKSEFLTAMTECFSQSEIISQYLEKIKKD